MRTDQIDRLTFMWMDDDQLEGTVQLEAFPNGATVLAGKTSGCSCCKHEAPITLDQAREYLEQMIARYQEMLDLLNQTGSPFPPN